MHATDGHVAAYIGRMHTMMGQTHKPPERTLKSYVMQDAEARSREA